MTLPTATIRNQVDLPLRLRSGRCTTGIAFTFEGLADGGEHLAIALGRAPGLRRPGAMPEPPLVRLHSECLTGDVLGSQRCDCGPQLEEALELISRSGGYLLYLRQEGRGIGLYAKLDAYRLQAAGLDTYAANRALGYRDDERDYTVAAQMLTALGVSAVRLLTNNPDKTAQLDRLGVSVVERVATGLHLTAANRGYLAAKVVQQAHALDLTTVAGEGG